VQEVERMISTHPIPGSQADDSTIERTLQGFDLHGLAAIGLVNATKADAATVAGQLGMSPQTLRREPEIVIRFVDELETDEGMRLLGAGDSAYTEQEFIVLRSKNKTPAKVSIPFDRVGRQCEIVCERGVPAIPLLIPIINATILGRGALPVHASAFRYEGLGVLVTGWAKGGKTEILFGFMNKGAEYVGDEWIYMRGDGRQMYGVPEPMRLWDWHLSQLPSAWAELPSGKRARLRSLRHVSALLKSMKAARRLTTLVDSQRYAHLPPSQAFGKPLGPLTSPVDLVIFTASHTARDIHVEPVSGEEVAVRMAVSLQEERASLMSAYRKFRFAFPSRINLLLESLVDIERERLRLALAGKPCLAVYHPYPPTIEDLYKAILPHLAAVHGAGDHLPLSSGSVT
jgi:hypothetical protein